MVVMASQMLQERKPCLPPFARETRIWGVPATAQCRQETQSTCLHRVTGDNQVNRERVTLQVYGQK